MEFYALVGIEQFASLREQSVEDFTNDVVANYTGRVKDIAGETIQTAWFVADWEKVDDISFNKLGLTTATIAVWDGHCIAIKEATTICDKDGWQYIERQEYDKLLASAKTTWKNATDDNLYKLVGKSDPSPY